MNTQVRVLSLAAKSDGSSVLYRLEQGSVLQFRPGPTLLGCRIDLFTNHPLEASEGSAFHRETFRRLSWKFEAGNERDDTGAYVNLPLVVAGSFKYYFTCDRYVECSHLVHCGHTSLILSYTVIIQSLIEALMDLTSLSLHITGYMNAQRKDSGRVESGLKTDLKYRQGFRLQ